MGSSHGVGRTVFHCFIVVSFNVGFHELEVNDIAVFSRENVVLEIFTCLDIILIGVCPVQLHFLAFVGYGIDPILIPALRYEITIVIISAKNLSDDYICHLPPR